MQSYVHFHLHSQCSEFKIQFSNATWLTYSSMAHSCERIMTVAITIVVTSSNLFLHKGITSSDTKLPFSSRRIGHILTKYVRHFPFHHIWDQTHTQNFSPERLTIRLYVIYV